MSAFYNVDQPPFNMSSAARAIAAANNGLLFDIGDMSTLYQDAEGTVPVTAVEQPVGKILDKSGNGNHATQSVTASRPVLSARYNLLTKTEDFSDAVWFKNYCTVTTNTTTDPFGGTNAATITSSSSTTSALIYQVVPAMISGATYTVSRYVKAGSVTKCTLGIHGLADIYFDLNALTYNAIGTGFISASIVDVGNGWRKITGSWTWSGNIYQVYFALASTMSSQIGVPVGGYLYSFGHSLVLGTTSGPYQRVNTATDYDTDERYFPKYLRLDAVDDFLNLPFMNLYGGGAASIICARDAISQSVDTYILSERSTTDADPKYFPSRQLASAGNMDAYISDDAGAVVLDTIGSPFSGVANAVIRSIVDSGNNLKLFKNGVLGANDNYMRSGTLTLNNTTLGASVSTTTSNCASMKMYGLIITKSALTDAQRIKCERFLARKAGVML